MTTPAPRKLPAPIKPRTLRRAHDGHGYRTTDGRYQLHPAYRPATLGGRTSRVTHWVVTDLRAADGDARTFTMPDLETFRTLYCAPGGKVPWVALDMDDGVLRVEATRTALLDWLCTHEGGRVIQRETIREGYYYYLIGYSEDDHNGGVWIARADAVGPDGWQVDQEPWFPYPDDPHETGLRAEATERKRGEDE